jgi:hypothetical protein
MPCSHQHHNSQDCCKNMTTPHAPFFLPSSGHRVAVDQTLIVAVPAAVKSNALSPWIGIAEAHSHAPPATYSSISPPIRI